MDRFYHLVDEKIVSYLEYIYAGLSVKEIQKLEKDLCVEFPLAMAGFYERIGGGHLGELPGYEDNWNTVILYRPYDIKNEMEYDKSQDQGYYLRRIPIGYYSEYTQFRVNCRKESANYGRTWEFTRPHSAYQYIGDFPKLVIFIGKKLKKLEAKIEKREKPKSKDRSVKRRKIRKNEESYEEREGERRMEEEYNSDSEDEPEEEILNQPYNFECKKPVPYYDYT
eukprot:Phypoly_transcript_12163.p1 GENE.Phypoly_transcript_12163~~Phypoly_transcript_12163.p1  ORF type:complete len:224 (+),score=42.27 Phypoly_transcript_12163:283-954(+)